MKPVSIDDARQLMAAHKRHTLAVTKLVNHVHITDVDVCKAAEEYLDSFDALKRLKKELMTR